MFVAAVLALTHLPLRVALTFVSQTPVTDDPAQLAALILDGIANKNWWLVAAPALTLVVWVTRTYGAKWFPKLAPVLTHPVVSFLIPIVLSILGGLITAALAGPITGPVVIGVVLASLKVSTAAISTYVGLKKVGEAREQGAASAAKIDNVDKAIDSINKPGGPGEP